MNTAYLAVVYGPLFKSVKLVETAVEGNVADEVECLARVTATRGRKNGIATSLQTTTRSWYGVGIVSLKKKKKHSNLKLSSLIYFSHKKQRNCKFAE